MLAVERAASLAAAAAVRRPDSELPGALRWLGRARSDVHAALSIVRALLPERFEAVAPSLTAFAAALGLAHDVEHGPGDAGAAPGVLRTLRGVAAAHLAALPAPLGFRSPSRPSSGRRP